MKKKINFNKLLFEFISVSFAVTFALFVNQWREDYNNQKLAQNSLRNIKEELLENKETLEELLSIHEAHLEKIDSLMLLEVEVDEDSISDVNIVLLSSSAWEMAKVTQAVYYIPFDDINNLAKVYDFKLYYESLIKQHVLKDSFSSDVQVSLKKQKSFLETIIPMERDLAHYCELMLTDVLKD